MRFALMLESQQGLSYGDHVAIAKRAEANGIEALFRSDHYTSFPVRPGSPPPTHGPSSPGLLARRTGSASASSSRPSRFAIRAASPRSSPPLTR